MVLNFLCAAVPRVMCCLSVFMGCCSWSKLSVGSVLAVGLQGCVETGDSPRGYKQQPDFQELGEMENMGDPMFSPSSPETLLLQLLGGGF